MNENTRAIIWGLTLSPVCLWLIFALIVGVVFPRFRDRVFDWFLRYTDWAT